MEDILKQIMAKLEKLDEIELDVSAIKNDVKLIDKLELDVSAIKNDVKIIDKKVDGITEVVAKTMEDIMGLNGKLERQEIEMKALRSA